MWKSGAGRGLLSTCGGIFVEVWCREATFVHKNGIFCGCGGGIATACPRRGCFLWKFGARRRLLSTKKVSFVDAEGKCSRLSTNKAHFVDEMGLCGCHGLRWCLSGVSVCLSGPAKVPLGTLSEPSRNPPGASGRITTQTARLLGRGRTCRRCG